MKTKFCFVVLALLIATPLGGIAQARTIRLFLIGNSFSQNATRYLPQMAKAGGHELIVGRAELGGHSLAQHWSYAEAAEANADDPKGKAYKGKTLRELLSAGTWDIVTLQQASILSADVETYRPYAQKLRDYVKTLQPQAEVVMHQTWAYRSDAKTPGHDFGKVNREIRAQDQREMWEKSHAAYNTIAEELGLRVIPNGDAFWAVDAAPKWGYRKDIKFDPATAVYPQLPDQTYSLHAGYRWATGTDGINKLAFDPNHSSDAGMYLGGLVWYGFLFGESPETVKFTPPEIPADFAAFLRRTATRTLQEQGGKFAPVLAD